MPSDRGIPLEAEVLERVDESPGIFTLSLRLVEDREHRAYRFQPGQFNMLYLYGSGEVPISVVADRQDSGVLTHTIRALGRITNAMAQLKIGDRIGLRGPYGRGWPMREAEDHDVIVVTGGLGCAPSVSIIHHILSHRDRFRHLSILQGVKHTDDLIWRDQYAAWAQLPDVQVLLAADVADAGWHGHVGLVTTLFDRLRLEPAQAVAMLCGPEIMMRVAAHDLHTRGLAPADIYLSMERNMQCAVGHCGHCQMGGSFVCRDGPVFAWPEIRDLLGVRGF